MIELLLVIGLIGTIIGLTLGAVQRARVAALRSQCANKLRQLALASHQYHEVHRQFPRGLTSDTNPSESLPKITWQARLLPFLGEDHAWRETLQAYAANRNFQEDPPHTPRSRVMPVFSCPSDARMNQPAYFGGSRMAKYALTSYQGNEGINAIRRDGVLFVDSEVRLADVADGSSQTLFAGERPPSANLKFGWWYAGSGMQDDGDADTVLGVRTRCRESIQCPTCGDDPYHFQAGEFDNPCSFLHFWSPHSAGANFAFADASVRFLSYSVDPLLPSLATRAGGEAVELP
jgi:prepilin-type processing-associated H-X9-DG protein